MSLSENVTINDHAIIFTARHYARAVYAMVVCLSVCLCVCLSQVGVPVSYTHLTLPTNREV